MSARTLLPSVLAIALTALTGLISIPHARADDSGRTIFVPRAVIYPGDTITEATLIERQLIVSADNPPVYGENEADLIGKKARRTLLPGQLIPESGVRTEELVKQGRTYKMTYESSALSISGVGVPMQSGSAGEIINVRNPETGLIVKARVRSDQTLAVDAQ
jgi:flagellar basal body P-ring formation protein FlgA